MKQQQKQVTVCLGVLIDHSKILLIQRKEPELPEAHLKWEFPGGKLEFGETPQQAVAREFIEETGRQVKVGALIPKVGINYWSYDWGVQQTICLYFSCQLIKDNESQNNDHHVQAVNWFDLKCLNYQDCLPGTKEIIQLVAHPV